MKATDRTEQWWSSHDCRINGVFKGGGAKGVLYAGALLAVEERGLWFRSVAGASAGAITATLVASGVEPASVGQLASEGLGKIRRNFLFDIIGRPFVRTERLRDWIEDLLNRQIEALTGVRSSGSVSFGSLYDASQIDLYIVCVDVGTRQPMVFNHLSTPEVAVADALLASSAIPIAFRPARFRVAKNGTEEVHRLMDGGVWANYPSFVFKDASFRTFHGFAPIPSQSTTIGFTLDTVSAGDSAPSEPRGFEPANTRSSSDLGAGLRGWLRHPALRIYLFTVAPLLLIAQAMWTTSQYGLLVFKDIVLHGERDFPSWVVSTAAFVDGFFSNFTPALWALVIAVVVFALGMLLIGATLLDSAWPALRTLMAVGTDVPYWVGAASDDYVIRLDVPRGLDTFSFKVDSESLEGFIEEARSSAIAQLSALPIDA